jgi:hypothetical protein
VARPLFLPDRHAWQAQRITSGIDQFLDECGLGACVRLARTMLARQPQLEFAVAPCLLRVPAEMIAEQPLVAGRAGGVGHHLQVMGGGAVTVARWKKQSVRHARVDQLVAKPGEDGSGGKPVLQALHAGHHVDDRLGGKPRHRRAADVLQPQEPGPTAVRISLLAEANCSGQAAS